MTGLMINKILNIKYYRNDLNLDNQLFGLANCPQINLRVNN